MHWLEVVIPILCAILSSPFVLQAIQRLRIVHEMQLEDEVEHWVKLACSSAERWAANRRKAHPEAAISSADKLAHARDVVRRRAPGNLDDLEIQARIEHELVTREAQERAALAASASGSGVRTERIEKQLA